MRFKASISAVNFVNVDFTVQIACKIDETYTGATSFSYKIGSDTTSIVDLGSATYSSYCVTNGGSSITYTAKKADGTALPGFIVFDPLTK